MKISSLPLLAIAAVLGYSHPCAAEQTPATLQFPAGVDWSNASFDQISESVYQTAKANPDQALQIAVDALNAAKATQRFPSVTSMSDGKQTVDPSGSIEELARRIGEAAKQANPSLAPQIESAMISGVPTMGLVTGTDSSGGGSSGGGTTSGGGVPLPGGFGGGGGGGSSGGGSSDGGGSGGGGGGGQRPTSN